MKKKWIMLAAGIVVIGMLTGCADEKESQDTSQTETVSEEKTVIKSYKLKEADLKGGWYAVDTDNSEVTYLIFEKDGVVKQTTASIEETDSGLVTCQVAEGEQTKGTYSLSKNVITCKVNKEKTKYVYDCETDEFMIKDQEDVKFARDWQALDLEDEKQVQESKDYTIAGTWNLTYEVEIEGEDVTSYELEPQTLTFKEDGTVTDDESGESGRYVSRVNGFYYAIVGDDVYMGHVADSDSTQIQELDLDESSDSSLRLMLMNQYCDDEETLYLLIRQ
ncbi:MAG: hypothetical protein K6G01_10880 [Eubacterium sp.]|nr:hypothetical protein [Eubacterium sp.]